jgi:DNA mismatch endonuclease (patch repair protein)
MRSSDTKPKMVARSLLHSMGYRFTVNGPKNRSLPGKPDIVLPKYRTVIFLHECFWHRHKGSKDATTPKTRTEWWEAKFAGNVARDLRNQRSLRKAGWRVVVIWECELSKPCLDRITSKIRKHLTAEK